MGITVSTPIHRLALVILALLLVAGSSPPSTAATSALDAALPLLEGRDLATKKQAVQLIATSGNDRAVIILDALVTGNLYFLKSDNSLVIAEKNDDSYLATYALLGTEIGPVEKRGLKKIGINNALRSQLRDAIASLSLDHADRSIRLRAATQMLDNPSAGTARLLRSALPRETDDDVRKVMQTAVSVTDLASADTAARLAAIQQLAGNLHPTVRNQLLKLSENDKDDKTRTAARLALKEIDFKVDLYGKAEVLFFGISAGSVLVLAAIGLAITFGVMGVINMAHGELIMLGAYTTYLIQQLMPQHIGLSVLVAIPAAFVVSGLVGILIERSVIRFLYGRPLETLLATFGISLILQQLVRTLVSPQNVAVSNPGWMSGTLEINSVLSLAYNRLYIILFCLIVFMLLSLVLKRTPLGLQVRAVSQNRDMARAMGVRSARVDALTFGLGSGIAGVAGVALSQLTNVGPNLGQSYIIDSFMVVVFGGVGNLWGTLVGGLTLGIANKVLEPWAGAVLAKILVLVFIILFIQKRPRGLFPQKGRGAVN